MHQRLVEVLLQLLARIDGGAAFAIDQIPVKDLQHLLASLFENLLLKKTRQAGAHSSSSQQPSSQPMLKFVTQIFKHFTQCFPQLAELFLAGCIYQAITCGIFAIAFEPCL